MIPVAVLLSVWIGVGGCVYPSYLRVILNFAVSFVFKKRFTTLDSAADAVTPMILHNFCMAPLRTIGFPDFMFFREKNSHWLYYVPWSH